MNLNIFNFKLKMTSKKVKKAVMPEFDNIQVSTHTVIAKTNSTYDTQRLFQSLPITPYIVIPKKRGRKKVIQTIDPNKDVPTGSIITLKFTDQLRGVNLKPNKKKSSGKYFRNALSIVMKVKDKLLNFKLSKNGKIQMTGVKTKSHAIECAKHLWQHIININDHTLYNIADETLKITFKVVMTNIDFSVGFLVDRNAIDEYFNINTNYNSLLETSFGYTGVNIKFPINGNPYNESNLFMLETKVDKIKWQEKEIKYSSYFETLSNSDKKKENNQRYNTFLVFHSGNVIMSGPMKQTMKPVYYSFLELIKNSKDFIEENLDE